MFVEWYNGDSQKRPETEFVLVVLCNGDRFLGTYDSSDDTVLVEDSGIYIGYPFGKIEFREAIEWWTEIEFPER